MTGTSEREALIKKTKVIVHKYRLENGSKNRPLSYVRFAKALGQFGQNVSYQTIKNWEDGVHAPEAIFIIKIINSAPPHTWQHSFAQEILMLFTAP